MLERIKHGPVLELRLNRPPENAFNLQLVSNLLQAVSYAPRERAQAIVLSGVNGVFSTGADVPEILAMERNETQRYFVAFHDLCRAVGRSPIPIVAALTGHAPASATVLALFCDYRIMARGEYQIGLNEVHAGVTVPHPVRVMMARLVGQRMAERLIVEGRLLLPEDALRIGLVDETAPPETVVACALAYCRRLLALPTVAMNAVRDAFHEDVNKLLNHRDAIIDELINDWFSEDTQANLRAIAGVAKPEE